MVLEKDEEGEDALATCAGGADRWSCSSVGMESAAGPSAPQYATSSVWGVGQGEAGLCEQKGMQGALAYAWDCACA